MNKKETIDKFKGIVIKKLFFTWLIPVSFERFNKKLKLTWYLNNLQLFFKRQIKFIYLDNTNIYNYIIFTLK